MGAGGISPDPWTAQRLGIRSRHAEDYYQPFFAVSPDLNWPNPEVVEAMLNVVRFWLKRGADGFRVNVLWHLIKDEEFRDNPPNPLWREGMDLYDRLIPIYRSTRSTRRDRANAPPSGSLRCARIDR